MDKSESIKEIAKALKEVQANLKPAVKDSVNPFYKMKYADLGSVWDACRELLAANGLAVTQTTDVGQDNSLIVETTLLHVSGEWITGSMPMILPKQDPQGIGSAITYARRYGLAAIIGICPEDDDAESAIDRKPSPVKKESPPKAEPEPQPKPASAANKPPEEKSSTIPPEEDRDISKIKNIEQLAKALKDDFGMTYQEQWDTLGISSWNDLAISCKEAYQLVSDNKKKGGMPS